jgi:phage anti-repressor protein
MGRSFKRKEKVTGDEEIKAATGKNWQEWFALLDEYGVEERGHELTVKHLREHHKLSEPMAKEVALRYENDRGLRNLTS